MKRQASNKQKTIIDDTQGLFTVRACPGSGKTYTVAARLHKALKDWKFRNQGIAVTSFTNVAWQEIGQYLKSDFGVSSAFEYPHFLGTLDSFINKYIFLPFGHLAMGCGSRPVLSGPPHDDEEAIGKWLWWRSPVCNKQGCQLGQFSYDANGKLIRLQYPDMGEDCKLEPRRPCIDNKRKFNNLGLATQADSNYFALKILNHYPIVAGAVARRFPVIMVDEAQDTSTIQMRIMDHLVESGLKDLMLVGDPDQAIYEWRDAEPQLFVEKCEAWKENSVELTENWRSSQLICDCASRLSSAKKPITAVNPDVSKCAIPPTVLGYSDENDLRELANRFIGYCSDCDVPKSEVTILTRGRGLLNSLMPSMTPHIGNMPWRNSASAMIAKAKFMHDNGESASALRILEREVCKIRSQFNRFDHADLSAIYESVGFSRWRGTLFRLLCSLPATSETTLGEWAAKANELLKKNPDHTGLVVEVKSNSQKCKYRELTFAGLFRQIELSASDGDVRFQTVHAVKGETLEAVMIVLKRKAGRSGNYVNLLKGSIEQSEELRIAYVAITRACRVLTVAVPAQDVGIWQKKLGVAADTAQLSVSA
jgi:superfamily I DNA/RNA helicase